MGVKQKPEDSLSLTRCSVQDEGNFQKRLWFQQMKKAVRRRAYEDARRENAAIERGLLLYRQPHIGQFAYTTGLSQIEKDRLEGMVFTTNGAKNTAAMDRLFESWLALGYPQSGKSFLVLPCIEVTLPGYQTH